ncbi:hypothetical protein QFZ88_005352 [Mesorhizobium sp. YL-MeA3-2017]|nr:GSU2403 family nucleotidyltransferase fold protein [Mesorhizobium sp. YL-MeA3-2017]MDQ0332970.1 hypothetical protein [Mesorhizobium sp. YL-MeA3-2017]
MERQTAVNRALRLGRVPLITARIIRAIDQAGIRGEGIRIAGTNAIYAYEAAAAGVFVDPGITATGGHRPAHGCAPIAQEWLAATSKMERSSTSCAKSIGPSSVHPRDSER